MIDIFNEINIDQLREDLSGFEQANRKVSQSMEFGIIYVESGINSEEIIIKNLTQDLLPFKDSNGEEQRKVFPVQDFISRLEQTNKSFFEDYISYIKEEDNKLTDKTKKYLQIESFIESKRNIANANAFLLGGKNGYGTLNLRYGYISNNNADNLKLKVQESCKTVFEKLSELKSNEDTKVFTEKDKKTISFPVISNAQITDSINKDISQIENIFNNENLIIEDIPYLLILNIEGLSNKVNLNEGISLINSFWSQVNEKESHIGICKSCLQERNVVALSEFVSPVAGKKTLSFQLNKNSKELDKSGYICNECLTNMREISSLLESFNFLFINRTENKIVPLKGASDLLKDSTSEELKLGGSLYKIFKGSDPFLGAENKTPFVKFIYQMEFNFLIPAKESRERYILINMLLTLFTLSKRTGRDSIFDINFKPFASKTTEGMLIDQLIKNHFVDFIAFISGQKNEISSKIIVRIIKDIYFKKKNKEDKLILDKTPIFSLFNSNKEDFNLDKFKTGENKMSERVNSILEKHKNEDKTYNQEEVFILVGALISYLMSKSKENYSENYSEFNSMDYGFVRDIQINKSSLSRLLLNTFKKYSHSISVNQTTFREKFSLILESLETVDFKNKFKIQELIYIGLLNPDLRKIFVKYQEENKTEEK